MMQTAETTVDSPRRRSVPVALALAMTITLYALLMVIPSGAQAVTMVQPKFNEELDYLNIYPTFLIEPKTGQTPKWVLISENSDMSDPARFCRAFYGQYTANGIGWACRSLAVGVDQWGRDVVRPLTKGTTYYWNVTYTDSTGTDQVTATRPFVIAKSDPEPSIASISAGIVADTEAAGLNTGKAAPSKSGVTVGSIKSTRVRGNRYRIDVRYKGDVRVGPSYIFIKGSGSKQRLRLKSNGKGTAYAIWKRPASSRKRKTARHKYQAHLVSNRNGARVKSPVRIIVFKGSKMTSG